jgi:hypothetical protein
MTLIKNGCIIVDDVHIQIDSHNVKVYLIQLTSKYAEVFYTFLSDGNIGVGLTAGESTIKYDSSTNLPTEIVWEGLGNDWRIFASVSKCTVEVCLYKQN